MSKKKNYQLGSNFCTASNKLKKQILFFLVKKLNLDICFRCNKLIEKIEEFSVDHKISWQDSVDPVKLFYDIENIAFSHLKCNVNARKKCHKKTNNKTGFKGVTYDTSAKHYKKPYRAVVQTVLNGKPKKYRLGRFNTAEEAALAYDNKARELFKENAVVNFEG